jgi:hypothetical protein
MPPPVPRTLAEYPWVVVTVSCKLCARRGVYRLARLAARYGPDQTLDGLLADLAHGCPYWRTKPRQYEVRCGARFEDLDRPRPVDMVPAVDHAAANGNAPRAKEPPREAVPTRRSARPATMTGPGRTLSTWEGESLTIACSKCGRRNTYVTRDLMTAERDPRLTDLRSQLTADCPRVVRQDMSDWCGARFEP